MRKFLPDLGSVCRVALCVWIRRKLSWTSGLSRVDEEERERKRKRFVNCFKSKLKKKQKQKIDALHVL